MPVIVNDERTGYMEVRNRNYDTPCKPGSLSYNSYYGYKFYSNLAVQKQGSRFDSNGWRPPNPYFTCHMPWYGPDYRAYYDHKPIKGVFAGLHQWHESRDYYVGAQSSWAGMAAFTVPTWVQSTALNNALGKLKTDIDLSETLKDLPKTIQMIVRRLYDLGRIWSACRSRNPAAIRRAIRQAGGNDRRVGSTGSKTASDLWLEALYGWRPLVMDIYGAADAASKILRHNQNLKATVKSGCSDTPSASKTFDFSLNSSYYLGTAKLRVDMEQKCFVRLDFVLESPYLAAASALGLTNPINSLYQWTSLSFVLDWVLPIGNYLSALDATLGWKFKGGSKTTVAKTGGPKYEFVRWTKLTQYECNPPHAIFRPGTSLKRGNYYTLTRTVYLTAPTPMLPWFGKDPLSIRNLLTTIALLRQRM